MKIENYLPPKFIDRLYAEHVRLKFAHLGPDADWATYDCDSDEIQINADLDQEKLTRSLNARFGLTVDPDQIWLALCLHETGHRQERFRLRGIEKIQSGSDVETLMEVRRFRGEAESAAWAFALREFWDFRFDSAALADFKKWKAGLTK